MSAETKISWADSTASPWFGCTEVSPGCANCYAREITLKRKWAGWGDNAPRVRAKGFWKNVAKWNRAAEVRYVWNEAMQRKEPFRPRIFPSLMDWLDPKVPIGWLDDLLKVIFHCRNLNFLLLTKRPEFFRSRLAEIADYEIDDWLEAWFGGRAPQNAWLGVTCEDQKRADERIPELLKIPAKVRFLSCEPLLQSIGLELRHGCRGCNHPGNIVMATNADGQCSECGGTGHEPSGIDWVIVGGESGPKRRDCGWQAIRDVAEQCVAAGVPVWVKQDCAARPGQQGRIPDEIWNLKQLPT